jgi:xanthine dehydrogenase small subunit
LHDALTMLRDDGPLVPLAGCTDLYVGLNAGTLPARRFLNLSTLTDLRGITAVNRRLLRIGALTTFTDIATSRLVWQRVPMLARASREIGAVQIQNRGTLGGNIANASPAGDTLPVLLVAEARIELRRVDNVRMVPATEFFTGYRQTVMRPDELITSIEFTLFDGVQWFRKVGTRAAQSISKVVMAGVRDDHPRIAFGSVAPTVVRAARTEAALAAGMPLIWAQRLLQKDISPIDDIRSTAAYRRRVAANMLAQFWEDTSFGDR